MQSQITICGHQPAYCKSLCKSCYDKQWYAANREKVRLKGLAWKTTNRAKVRKQNNSYYLAHPPTATYHSWRGMLLRCRNPKAVSWKNYGGRGITVCARWDPKQGGSFENFLADMGERPAGLTLDRRDNNLGYLLENCRWATWQEQRANHR